MHAAWMLSTLVRGLLFSIQPHDPAVYVAVALAISALATLAAVVPARRAASVDPIIALRCE
jgi:ABC-type lipoprotein release transport system permease subunit